MLTNQDTSQFFEIDIANDKNLDPIDPFGESGYIQTISQKHICSYWVNCVKKPGIEHARGVAWASIFFTILLSCLGMIVQYLTDSASTLANSLDSFLDIFTSILLLWRFKALSSCPCNFSTDHSLLAAKPDGLNRKNKIYNEDIIMEKREERAQVLVAFSFIILSFMVSASAIQHILDKERVTKDYLVLMNAIPSLIIQLILGQLKVHIGKHLESMALKNDGISSLLGSFLSVGIILDTVVMDLDKNVWFLDAIFAVIVAILLMVFAVMPLQRLNWRKKSFWFENSSSEQVLSGMSDLGEKRGRKKSASNESLRTDTMFLSKSDYDSDLEKNKSYKKLNSNNAKDSESMYVNSKKHVNGNGHLKYEFSLFDDKLSDDERKR